MTRTKTLVFTVISMLTAAGVAPASDEQDVLVAEQHWAKGVTTRDFAALQRIYSDDLIYAHSTGVVETKAEYLDKLKTGATRYDLIERQQTIVKLFDNTAIAHGVVHMKGTSETGPFNARLMVIHVWVRQQGEWRLAAHQTTKLEDL